jgi:DNA-binding response OmpR family regulator
MVKVMLIEDDTTMHYLLNTLLTLEGYEVQNSTGSGDILRTMQRNDPDLIMVDVHLGVAAGV